MRTLTHTVCPEDAGRTVLFCLKKYFGLAEGAVSRLKWQPGGILLNGEPARVNVRVCTGDVLSAQVGDTRPGGEFAPVDVPLDLLYEDEDLLIVNKPAGLAVHGRSEKGDPTLGGALAFRYGPDTVFHPVNRLDRDTSGAMVIARSGYIHDRLRRILHTPDFRREYLAVASGIVSPTSGVVDAPIGTGTEGWKQIVRPDGRPAVTRYETVGTVPGYTLLRVFPETGRTHQIRVHMAFIGYPLAGDRLYGAPDAGITRHALHSARVTLIHPVTGARISETAPLPEDIKRLWNQHQTQEIQPVRSSSI
ncbi:MAG: RluA family pseudouridine synthase [Oscillospiraceae bacterium]|nr:RluA family pseudouridine synthase [Oscillospiraceae bacterium]